MTHATSAGRLLEGKPDPRGVTISGSGINVAVHSSNAERIEFCLFDEAGAVEVERFTLPARTGDVFHGRIEGIAAGARYGFRAHGPYDPHAGQRFNPAKLLLDPYALAIDRPFTLDPTMFGFSPGTGQPDGADSAAAMPKGVVASPSPIAQAWSEAVPWDRMVIAETHVRGLTLQHPGVPEEHRGTFAGLAAPAIIAHFKTIGITTLELMPAMAGLDERHLRPLGLTNYWNYNPIGFLAPDPRLAPGGWEEVRTATAALNAAGIEVILDVVFNHSGEGDAEGPTVSMRGLDNAGWYRLDPADPARYINDAGCGNILACDRPHVVRLAMDSLRAWAQFGGMNGFRFDLATTLGRRMSGFEPGAPLLSAIEQDPVLAPLRMIAEPWDLGPGGYQLGAFSARWGEWNDRYRNDIRQFWRGDGSIAALAGRLSGSADAFWSKRRPSRSINFITAHDGFTLADLVAYEHKHNDANGEQNRDGTNENYSWNNGVEGPTDDRAILEARRCDQRNLLATLFLSRGTPMMGPGSELGATQGGNNNAYAQDNPVSWIDWSNTDTDLPGFVAALASLRATNPSLTRDRFLEGRDVDDDGAQDVTWWLANGQHPGPGDWYDPQIKTLVAVMSAPVTPDSPAVNMTASVFHAGREPVELHLPNPQDGQSWRLILDTNTPTLGTQPPLPGGSVLTVPPRTVLVFAEVLADGAARRRFVAPEVLDRLAAAAGIAPEWFEVSGQRHVVGDDTKRALLAAMGLPTTSTGEARDRLAELVSLRQGRALPRTLAARETHPIGLRLAADPGRAMPRAVTITRQDGSETTVAIDTDALGHRNDTAPDGRAILVHDLTLPPQPVGRHRIRLDDRNGTDCALTVAPERSYLPGALAAGERQFGLAAHLYTLRDARDGGIGDFSTLAAFGEAAGRHGATLVGINPLHMLFPLRRERASPYHPSDRRFLDPIYLDVGDPEIVGDTGEARTLFERSAPTFAALRDKPLVDYTAVWSAKLAILEAAFKVFSRRRRTAAAKRDPTGYDAFVERGGTQLQRFATFQVMSEQAPDRDWMGWPADWQSPGNPAVAAFAAEHAPRVAFHVYLQWLCDRQLGAAAERSRAAGLSIGLYCDLAVGTAPDGAEAWAEQGAYARGASVGSPPDPFSATGQIWCLPPPNPIAPDRTGGSLLGSLLASNMRHAGALRIDHAMGLSRLFWVPDGAQGSEGAYVGYDFEANLADVAIESHRARCLIVGEDLGTVPEGFREVLDRNDILSYRVLFFEREGAAFKPAASYPRNAVACVATHDIAPLAGWWTGADITERRDVGQMGADEADRALDERGVERARLAEAIGAPDLGTSADVPPTLTAAVHHFVAATPSLLVMAQADDLLDLTDGVNLPGTDNERPNWRRRLPDDTNELVRSTDAEGKLPRRS